jgi:hypothetical protein
VFATASITYTDRFALTTVPSGMELEVRSPLTTITTNSTHLIIRTTLRLAVTSTTTFYGLVFYRGVFSKYWARYRIGNVHRLHNQGRYMGGAVW